MDTMIDDAMLANQNVMVQEGRSPQEPFYNMIQAAQQPLYEGCSTNSELFATVRLLSIKYDYNMLQNYYNEVVQLTKRMCPPNNCVPQNYGKTKKLVKDLGNDVIHIYSCRKGCMLFFKEDSSLDACKFCGHSRWKRQRSQQRNQMPFPYARMHYLPLKPRLLRSYASKSTAQHMPLKQPLYVGCLTLLCHSLANSLHITLQATQLLPPLAPPLPNLLILAPTSPNKTLELEILICNLVREAPKQKQLLSQMVIGK